MNPSSAFARLSIEFAGLPAPSAGLFAIGVASVPVGGASSSRSHPLVHFGAATTTFASWPALFAGPKDQSENAEEDEADLELETDQEQSQLPKAGHRPGADDGSPAARGGDDTINPSFP